MPSHCLNPCWLFVNRTTTNKLQRNSNQNTNIFMNKNAFENVVWKWRPFCPRGRVRSHSTWCKVCLTFPIFVGHFVTNYKPNSVLYYTNILSAWTHTELKRPPIQDQPCHKISLIRKDSKCDWVHALHMTFLHTSRATVLSVCPSFHRDSLVCGLRFLEWMCSIQPIISTMFHQYDDNLP